MRAFLDLAEMAAILVTVGLLGVPLARGIPRLSRAELAAWSWIAGLLALAGCEGSLLLLGLRPDPWRLWGLLAVSSLAFRGRASAVPRSSAPPSRIGKVAWGLALGGLALYSIQALSEPMWAWDYIAIWGLKGKMLYLSGGLPDRYFHDPQLAFLHPGYPLLLPALFAALATLSGGWDSQALALLYPGFELATLLLIWGFLRRRSGVFGAAAAMVLTAGLFPLYQTFLTGLADIPMSLGFVLAGAALLDALETDRVVRLRPLVLAALFCCTLKKEGTVFLLLLAGTAAARGLGGRRRPAAVAAAVLALVPLLQRTMLRLLRGPAADPDFRWSPALSRGGAELARRLSETGAHLLHAVVLRNLPAILAVATILVCTRRTFADQLLPALAVLAGLYAAAPAFSTWSDPVELSTFSFSRIVSALAPTLFLALGARISASHDRFPLRFLSESPTMT